MMPRFVSTTITFNSNASYTNSSNRGGVQYVFKFVLTHDALQFVHVKLSILYIDMNYLYLSNEPLIGITANDLS